MDLAWEIAYPLGALALLGALVYGFWSYKTRNRANDRITEAATHELYADPKSYPEKRAALEKEVQPD